MAPLRVASLLLSIVVVGLVCDCGVGFERECGFWQGGSISGRGGTAESRRGPTSYMMPAAQRDDSKKKACKTALTPRNHQITSCYRHTISSRSSPTLIPTSSSARRHHSSLTTRSRATRLSNFNFESEAAEERVPLTIVNVAGVRRAKSEKCKAWRDYPAAGQER